jgi:ABC-type phosphate/phosphonate transport system substrate-binding protein
MKVVNGDIPMSKRFLILAALLAAAILVSGCCCCCTSDRSLYGPAATSSHPSVTPHKVTVTVVPVENVTPTASPTVPVVTPK